MQSSISNERLRVVSLEYPAAFHKYAERMHCPQDEIHAFREHKHCPQGENHAFRERKHCPQGENRAFREQKHCPQGETFLFTLHVNAFTPHVNAFAGRMNAIHGRAQRRFRPRVMSRGYLHGLRERVRGFRGSQRSDLEHATRYSTADTKGSDHDD